MKHLIPLIHESLPHETTPNCFCVPEREPDGKWIHNSWDGLPGPFTSPEDWEEVEGEDD